MASKERLRVSIIGIDGATWKVIDPLLGRGQLPNFARLIENGVRAPLQSLLPLLSPPIWTTIATGVPRSQHGITHFLKDGRLVANSDRKVPALWTLASAAGLRSAVVGWWVTYPAETINGIVVSDRAIKLRERSFRGMFKEKVGVPDKAGLVYPPAAFEVLAASLADPVDENLFPLVKLLRQMQAEDTTVAHCLCEARRAFGPFDLEMLLMRGTDPVSHHFWKFHEPDSPAYAHQSERPGPVDMRLFGSAIEKQYRHVDSLLAEVFESAGPDRVFFVVSDHGFEASERTLLISGDHKGDGASRGIFIAAGGPFRRGQALAEASILDIAPTVLHLLGLPIADYLAGRVLSEALDPDWLRAHPVRTVVNYPVRAVTAAKQGGSGGTTSLVDEAILEQLRGLGYIE